jgi:aminoglycoside phosphotransferase (APT) family kinase protein
VRLSDRELRAELERALATVGLLLAGEVERRPSPYRTSFPIEEVRVEIEGEGETTLACKRLDWEELEAEAQLAKPRFLHDPGREPAVYAAVLPQAPPGPPRHFGSVATPDSHCLFVEWVEGRELFQVGERELWEEAARWLARFHAATAPELDRHRRRGRLVDHDAGFYRRWIERAQAFAAEAGGTAGADPAAIGWLAERHEPVVEALLALPRSVIHGEFYASNVLVVGSSGEARVAPVDWELAAAGPGLTDLAALVGGWDAPDREAIAAAYEGVDGASLEGLDFARLQLAVQWLGWAPPRWAPPEGQRHDWLGEAVELAEGLDL